MNLPFLKKFNKKIVPSYYLVLVLRDEKATAVIFEELEGVAKIVGLKEEHFSTSIDEISSEELLEKLDKVISSAESPLPENIQTQKTIFGVKDSWTENDQIKKEYLTKLKKASEELELIPIGFLVVSQAIAHLLQKEEGAPVSAILAEVNKQSVTVTLLRAGKNIGTKNSEIHESIPFTVDTLLKHFSVSEILPSRIIIFNGKEDLSQEFISHTWSKSLPFLHLPQITNLPVGFDAKAVLFGAATQMGLVITETQKKDEAQEETEMQSLSDSVDNPVDSVPESFGFIKDIDVAKMPATTETQKKDETQKSELSASDTFSDSVVAKEEALPLMPKRSKTVSNILMIIKNILIGILGLIFSAVGKVKKGKLTIVAFAILIFVVTLIVSYFLFLKATITLTVDPKISDHNKSVLFSTIKTTDPDKNIIKGEFVTVSEDGSVSAPATGKKDVGTSAKGTVTIFNSLSQSKTLTEGTILKVANGLEFTLDSQTTVKGVASHSADENPPPEKTTANVTANQLGRESNLPSGTKFSIASFNTADLIAKNDNPFSGGTKKEVTVASKNDSAKLEENLIKQLKDKAKEDLQKQLAQNKILLPAFTAENIGKKSLNVKIGDETNQLTLTGTVEYQSISYSKDDLITLSKSFLAKDIPANQTADYSNIKTSVLDMKNKNDDEIEANLNIKTLLLPKIDAEKLIKDLKRKSFKDTQDLLYKIPQVANVNIKLSPNLPFLPKKLPLREKNIKFVIKLNG